MALTKTLIVSLFLVLCADEADKKHEDDALYGIWQTTEITLFGGKQRPETIREEWMIEKDKVAIVSVKGPKTEKTTRGLEIDSSADPKRIDLVFLEGQLKGKRLQGIYKVDDKFLTICLAERKGERPTTFASTRDDFTHLFVFERVVLKR